MDGHAVLEVLGKTGERLADRARSANRATSSRGPKPCLHPHRTGCDVHGLFPQEPNGKYLVLIQDFQNGVPKGELQQTEWDSVDTTND